MIDRLTRIKRRGDGKFQKGWSLCSKVNDRHYYVFRDSTSFTQMLGGLASQVAPTAAAGNINQFHWDYYTQGANAAGAKLRANGWTRNDVTMQPFLIGSYDQNIYVNSGSTVGYSTAAFSLSKVLMNSTNGAAGFGPPTSSTAIDNMKSPEMLEYSYMTPVGYSEKFVITSVRPIFYRSTAGSGFPSNCPMNYGISTFSGALLSTWPMYSTANPAQEMTNALQNSHEVPMTVYSFADYKNRDNILQFANPCNYDTNAKEMIRLWRTGLVKARTKKPGRRLSYTYNVSIPLKCWKKQQELDDQTFWSDAVLTSQSFTNAIRTWNDEGQFANFEGALPHTPGQGIFLWYKFPLDMSSISQTSTTADNQNQIRILVSGYIETKYTVCCSLRDGVLGRIGGLIPATLSFKAVGKSRSAKQRLTDAETKIEEEIESDDE